MALLDAIESPRWRTLGEDWERFLEEPALPDPPQKRAADPLVDVASRRVRRLYGRLVVRGRAVNDDTPDAELHRLRLLGKKLRYVLDTTKSLIRGGGVQADVDIVPAAFYSQLDPETDLYTDLRLRSSTRLRAPPC